jgi:asparagine synthase (glutamine-hydrolysing)
VNELLSPASVAARGLFDVAGVQHMVRQDRERRLDASYTIFSMMCIELWCRMFVDRATPSMEGL